MEISLRTLMVYPLESNFTLQMSICKLFVLENTLHYITLQHHIKLLMQKTNLNQQGRMHGLSQSPSLFLPAKKDITDGRTDGPTDVGRTLL